MPARDTSKETLAPWRLNTDLERLRDHINIFQARAGVEEHDLVRGFEETFAQQSLIRRQTGGAFRRGKEPFPARRLCYTAEDLLIGNRHGCAATLLEDIENNVVGVGFRHTQAGSRSLRALPYFGHRL